MRRTTAREPLERYLVLNYPYTVHKTEEGGYVAEIEDLPGCITQAETLQEIEARLEEACRDWITVAYEQGMDIPLPRDEERYSGRFVLRLPKYLHRHLAEAAKSEGVSLNLYVNSLLSNRARVVDISQDLVAMLRECWSPQLISWTETSLSTAWTTVGETHPMPRGQTSHDHVAEKLLEGVV